MKKPLQLELFNETLQKPKTGIHDGFYHNEHLYILDPQLYRVVINHFKFLTYLSRTTLNKTT